MTFSADPRTLPARPPSEVEWEDLLVRVEIAPRALRVAVEDAPAGHPGVEEALGMGVMGEMALQEMVAAMVDGRALPQETPDAGFSFHGAAELVAEYARLRHRSFVMVQRRGIDVWDWRVRGGAYDGATAYQLFQAAAQTDGTLLAAIRGAARGGAPA